MDVVKLHIPVMCKEIKEYLNLRAGNIAVDATLGTGGHSLGMLEAIAPGGRLIGIDRDQESLEIAKERLLTVNNNYDIIYGNFSEIDTLLVNLGVEQVDGILFDLGVSSYQLSDPTRGFSFRNDGPLDMRLDRNSYISAYDLINNLNEEEISNLLWAFGQERWHNRIARLLVSERKKHAISTTAELSDIVLRAVPYKYRYYRIHPATRTFQAVRIAVNRELEVLDTALSKAVGLLRKGGRICVISFHSLEDRIVKHNFRRLTSNGLIDIITDKPLQPNETEVQDNPASRSAKLRVAQRCTNETI
ncbi:MAG: 16S rRNA (cytosine(1402)-N(4))-methyltransferase RsmH [Candidatus Omnitrophota bacterium]|nr:16S rRNA (cytosine(1402)-N(4))-methyltransferase RsmH [Candidatus Omnitrophota bacterium]